MYPIWVHLISSICSFSSKNLGDVDTSVLQFFFFPLPKSLSFPKTWITNVGGFVVDLQASESLFHCFSVKCLCWSARCSLFSTTRFYLFFNAVKPSYWVFYLLHFFFKVPGLLCIFLLFSRNFPFSLCFKYVYNQLVKYFAMAVSTYVLIQSVMKHDL